MEVRPTAKQIRQFLGKNPFLTRFAPSPTGYLHLGHVVNALYVWGIAEAFGGRVVLRMEDHDRIRCRPEYEAALLEDLLALGLDGDWGKIRDLKAGPSAYRQSDRDVVYQKHLERLAQEHLVYACDCSRRQIVERTGQTSGELRYDGFCRDRGLPLESGLGWRVVLPDNEVAFQDLAMGAGSALPIEECGDLLLRDRDGNWTYQFAVVCDDLDHGIDFVIRGMDLESSTARQVLLGRMLGRDRDAIFFHHALLTDDSGRKLSKRDFAADIHSLLQQGVSPESIWGDAAWRAGLISEKREVKRQEIAQLFTKGGTPRLRLSK